ncbi:MAG: cyclodeaminase/cyclohydrolase family protein [Chloroflexia bacterium]|nr:cyclodeaminase/cyclohydrolase family protein [Chloroflexia bacterium]
MTAGRRGNALSRDTLQEFNRKVADPTFFCGGGSVAAISTSSSAALTLLVMRLSARRKANRECKANIERQIAELEVLQQRLYSAADSDLDVLDVLLNAQRHMKETGDRQAYQSALIAAARSPYEICRDSLQLLQMIEAQLPLASRFTVSDLGAAGALAMGAIQGAILTTDVNVALLRDEEGIDVTEIDRIEGDSIEVVRAAAEIAGRIASGTLAAIRPAPDGQQL